MELTVAGRPAFAYTGGRPFDAGGPVAVLIHGAGNDHSVWNFQARALAHHGVSVLAPDLPGHGRSAAADGNAPPGIESLARWIAALLDATGVERAALVGHSMGALIALQLAADAPRRITHLVLAGAAAPMPVAQPLLDAARNDPPAARAMINHWSYTPAARLGASASPGVSLTGMNERLMERQAEGVLAADLAACNAYTGGLEAAARVRCPVLMLAGERDQMTPRRAAAPLCEALAKAPGRARMITVADAGHAMLAEAPGATTNSIRGFLTER